jgi:predicted adenylyl cyclase CyaB
MGFINIEIKSRCNNLDKVREKLKLLQPRYQGTDHQIDTYFNIEKGKLKLREGNIENNLIFYERQKKDGPKLSKISTHKVTDSLSLKEILIRSHGIKVVVDKKREIYWINNVKFHLDKVKRLGEFVEIEAIDYEGNIGQEKLQEQCNYYLKKLGIEDDQLITNSYSDLLSAL